MSVRRLCDLKVNRKVAARAPGDNAFTFNDILDKSASCNYASKEVSCQTQGEGQGVGPCFWQRVTNGQYRGRRRRKINQTFAWTLKKKFMFTSIQKKFTNIFLRQLQLLQAEITTNTSSPVAGWQNDDRPVPVHESSGYRALIVWLLSSIQAPGGARPMSARTPFKSDAVLVEKKFARSKKSSPGRRPNDVRPMIFILSDPKNYCPAAVSF
jgi:hypothetical protein